MVPNDTSILTNQNWAVAETLSLFSLLFPLTPQVCTPLYTLYVSHLYSHVPYILLLYLSLAELLPAFSLIPLCLFSSPFISPFSLSLSLSLSPSLSSAHDGPVALPLG